MSAARCDHSAWRSLGKCGADGRLRALAASPLVRDLIIASSAWQLHAPHNAPKENGDLVMSSVTEELAALLSTVRRPGDYFVSGTIAMLAPGLEVDGVGAVALPLLPVQAEQLIAIADRAPYGRGKETLVDTEVRRTWQIGADHVRLLGKHWAGTLKTILVRVADGLGITDPIEAELYKLLVYDKGSFFASHRDTEKVPGMFATLVVVLPSSSTGGELVVRHKGREERLDLRCDDPSEAAFAAFYADCVHEVLPVTEGYRLTLVYNLSRRGQGPAPEAPDYDRQQTNVAALLRRWATDAESQDDETPEKLIYPLEHAYTPAELGFETLKGVDAAAARVLVAAAPQAGCDLHLALASIEESGAAEYNPDLGSSRRRWIDPEDELEAGEVFDRHAVLSEWRRPDDSRPTLGELPVLDEELSPPDAFDDMAPDEEHFHEATGNEGASFERTYRRAALVLWPRERFFAVLNQAGLPATLSYLGELTERWVAAGEDSRSPLWQQAHELSRHMIPSWPTRPWYSARSTAPSDVTRMLTLLMQFEDMVRLDTFLSEVVACGIGTKGDNAAILDALRLLSPDRAKALTESIVAGAAATSLDTSADLLARAAAAQLDGQPAELAGAAAALIEALPGDPARAASGDPWRRAPEVQPGLLVDLFSALVQIDEAGDACCRPRAGLAQDLWHRSRPHPGHAGTRRSGDDQKFDGRAAATNHLRRASACAYRRATGTSGRLEPGQRTRLQMSSLQRAEPLSRRSRTPDLDFQGGRIRTQPCRRHDPKYPLRPRLYDAPMRSALHSRLHQESGELRTTREAAQQGLGRSRTDRFMKWHRRSVAGQRCGRCWRKGAGALFSSHHSRGWAGRRKMNDRCQNSEQKDQHSTSGSIMNS